MVGRTGWRILGLLAASSLGGIADAQTCTLSIASVDSAGVQADSASGATALSSTGRFIAFNSSATNLVADTNSTDDVFVRDLELGLTWRVSEGTGGVEGNGPSSYPSMSADARFVVFSSWASSLVPNDTNNVNDVFLHDRELGTTERVSTGPGSVQGDGGSYLGSITPDGRFVVFLSFASNLVPGDTNGMRDVFLHDRVSATVERVSVSSAGTEADEASGGNSGGPFVSTDGRWVVFSTRAANLAPGDANGSLDIYVRDRLLGTTGRLSLGAGGAEPDDDCDVTAMTPDGRYIAFTSAATNLVAGDTNGQADAFVLDATTGTIERVSVATGGQEGSLSSWAPVISHDGRFVAYSSAAPDLVPNDSNEKRDVFLRDRVGGTTELVSAGSQQADADCFGVSISGDGGLVGFSSAATTLLFTDANYVADAFVRECRAAVLYCLGTASACPCGNAGSGSTGCVNSTGVGARLQTVGQASVAHDTLTLVASQLPPTAAVVFLQGMAPIANGFAFGDGLRCVGSTITRLGTRMALGGVASYGFVGTDPLLSVKGALPVTGDFRYYQGWYRNAVPFCTAFTFNLTNGAEVLWLP